MDSPPIRFSIIVPTYNRPRRLEGFLAELTRLAYPREAFEVVLVDDGSEPPLAPVAYAFRDRLNIVFLRQNHGGVARGRHAGVLAARGQFVAFTDDDCLPAPDWLRRLEGALLARPDSAAGGRTLNALPGNLYSTASQALITHLYERMNADPLHARFFANNNMAMPRDRYLEIGGLDTTWPMCGEDRDLCARWIDHGLAMTYVPEAIVRHAHDLDFVRFWRQHFNYGRGAYRFHRTCATRRRTSLQLESPGFYFALPLAAFKEAPGLRGIAVAALLLVTQVANTAGFVAERISPKQAASP